MRTSQIRMVAEKVAEILCEPINRTLLETCFFPDERPINAELALNCIDRLSMSVEDVILSICTEHPTLAHYILFADIQAIKMTVTESYNIKLEPKNPKAFAEFIEGVAGLYVLRDYFDTVENGYMDHQKTAHQEKVRKFRKEFKRLCRQGKNDKNISKCITGMLHHLSDDDPKNYDNLEHCIDIFIKHYINGEKIAKIIADAAEEEILYESEVHRRLDRVTDTIRRDIFHIQDQDPLPGYDEYICDDNRWAEYRQYLLTRA